MRACRIEAAKQDVRVFAVFHVTTRTSPRAKIVTAFGGKSSFRRRFQISFGQCNWFLVKTRSDFATTLRVNRSCFRFNPAKPSALRQFTLCTWIQNPRARSSPALLRFARYQSVRFIDYFAKPQREFSDGEFRFKRSKLDFEMSECRFLFTES